MSCFVSVDSFVAHQEERHSDKRHNTMESKYLGPIMEPKIQMDMKSFYAI